MNIANVYAQIEEELTWRLNEMRFFKNQLSYLNTDEEKDRFRRAMVVMLYSHYEGFCRTSLSIYGDAINQENLLCKEVNDNFKAASLAEAFKDYDNPFRKSEIFKSKLPDDSKLHKFARQVDLIAALNDLNRKKVEIPVDKIVDTESNLWPITLSKILFRLGFNHNAFKKYEREIKQLLNARNDIGHGSLKVGVSEKKYDTIEAATRDIMEGLKRLIIEALRNEVYKKVSTTTATISR